MKKDKMKLIQTNLEKAEKTLNQKEGFSKLKEDSKIKKICTAMLEYCHRDEYEACITIYEMYGLKGYCKKDEPFINLIKERLRLFKKSKCFKKPRFQTQQYAPDQQLKLFTT